MLDNPILRTGHRCDVVLEGRAQPAERRRDLLAIVLGRREVQLLNSVPKLKPLLLERDHTRLDVAVMRRRLGGRGVHHSLLSKLALSPLAGPTGTCPLRGRTVAQRVRDMQ